MSFNCRIFLFWVLTLKNPGDYFPIGSKEAKGKHRYKKPEELIQEF